MHICFLTPEYPHPDLGKSGGLGTSIKNLATRLVKEGVKVTVVVMGQKQDAVFMEEHVTFHAIKQREYTFLGFYRYRKFLERYLNHLCRVEEIDLIEAPDWTGITAFMKLQRPLVIRFNGSDAYFCKLDGRPQKKKNYLFEKWALFGADYLLSVSRFTADETRGIFGLKKEITVIPNSIDVNRFVPQPEKEQADRVFYFGTLIRKKGVLELAPIYNLVHASQPNTQFIFAGKDVVDVFTGKSTKAMIVDSVNDAVKESIHFLEELPYSDIQEEIAKATVVVLPSFAEAMPMTWLEAMAMGKALVTSDIGWAKELMIDDETGFTVHPKDHQTYANKISLLLTNKTLRDPLGRQARKRVADHFSSKVITQKNIDFYKSIINNQDKS
ncbi:MAG: glycosyltransferase family 4 protein [Flavobacteriaceae bacterium]|nr:glycosyltransferase family 4 protein [Flavobacteriaceae bacterium]